MWVRFWKGKIEKEKNTDVYSGTDEIFLPKPSPFSVSQNIELLKLNVL